MEYKPKVSLHLIEQPSKLFKFTQFDDGANQNIYFGFAMSRLWFKTFSFRIFRFWRMIICCELLEVSQSTEFRSGLWDKPVATCQSSWRCEQSTISSQFAERQNWHVKSPCSHFDGLTSTHRLSSQTFWWFLKRSEWLLRCTRDSAQSFQNRWKVHTSSLDWTQ